MDISPLMEESATEAVPPEPVSNGQLAPPPFKSLGKSSLFDRSQLDEATSITQFISHTGKKIALKRKEKKSVRGLQSGLGDGSVGSSVPGTYAGYDDLTSTSSSIWKSDTSYGININALLDKIEAASDSRGVSQSSGGKNSQSSYFEGKPEKLWVEKWRPRTFLDLVGNEVNNRRILGWLRQWAPLVFKEELPTRPSIGRYNNKDKGNHVEENTDPFMRPLKKILLIHGPPGIGKTSVAHVLSKQAGYSVMEINASDERAGQAVRDKVYNTLFSNNLQGKPVCLVADEIDGSVESGFVRTLIEILNKDIRATNRVKYIKTIPNGGVPSQQVGKRGKKKSTGILMRPIIAVCNNLYVPALEKLRPYCEIVSFKRPLETVLQERLRLICKKERVEVPTKLLSDIIDLAQGDIRNCINNLQFLATAPLRDQKHHPELQSGANRGQDESEKGISLSSSKDATVMWYILVNKLFQKDLHRDIRDQSRELLKEVEMNGNFDRILQGCFSLYPIVHYSDIGMHKPADISDWLYFHDLMFKSMFEHNGELLRYSSIVPLVFFQKFGDEANRESIRIKNSDFEHREAAKINDSIINLVVSRIATTSPGTLVFAKKKTLIFEVLPYLDYLLSADLSKVKQLKVKNSIVNLLVEILSAYGIELTDLPREASSSAPSPSSDGHKTFLGVNPPFNKAVLLDPRRCAEVVQKRPSGYSVLKLKLEENILRKRKRHSGQTDEDKERDAKIKRHKGNMLNFFKSQYDSMKNHSAEAQSNGKESAKQNGSLTKKTFTFGSGNTSAVDESKKASNGADGELRIWVKYKAGFSNAVRKNVTWETLWH